MLFGNKFLELGQKSVFIFFKIEIHKRKTCFLSKISKSCSKTEFLMEGIGKEGYNSHGAFFEVNNSHNQ